MPSTNSPRYLSMASQEVIELLKAQSQVFNNEYIGVIFNGIKPVQGFLNEGEVYCIAEARFIIVLEGAIEVSLDMEYYELTQGTILLTPPDVLVEMKKCSEVVKVIGVVLKEKVSVTESVVVSADASDFSIMLRMGQLLWDVANQKPFRRQTVSQMVGAMITFVQQLKQERENDGEETMATRQQALFRQFKTLVRQNCDCHRNIPFYAEQLHLTPHHLSSVIKRASGQSVMYWVNRAVVLRAKVLLRTSGMMTYEVAERLNFSSAAAFSNFFKRATGMTPRDYQEISF